MKRWLVVVLIVVLVAGGKRPPCDKQADAERICMAYRDVVLATRPGDMIAYYELNGNLTDSGPGGLTGAAGTDLTYANGGVGGSQAARFNGASTYIDLGANLMSALDAETMAEGTVILWARAATIEAWSVGLFGFLLFIDNGGDGFSIHTDTEGNVYGNAHAGTFDLSGERFMSDTDWHMIAITYSSANDPQGAVYIDGIPTYPAESGTVAAWTGAVTTASLGYSFASLWDGDIDEVTIWAAALTQSEILAIWNAGNTVYADAIPVIGTNAVVQIFDRTGLPIGEINPLVDFVSWRRNEIGQAQLTMAKSDPKANNVFLSAQNRVLIKFDNGLPDWGGIMQPDFTIEHSTITVKVLTAEILLNGRMTDQGRYFESDTVGDIATALIEEANAIVPTGLDIGGVWEGGDRHSPEYHYKNLLSIFQESLFSRLSTADFYAEPVVGSDGRLTFTLHIAERRGGDKPGLGLHQGLNLDDAIKVSYQGPVINRWVAIGDGDGWGDSRPIAAADDETSQQRYGILEASEIHQGVTMPATLQAIAENLLAQTANPRVILDVTAVDLPPARFVQYDVGDVLTVELPDYGIGSAYIGTAQVQSRAFYPSNGRLNLVLRATGGA